MVIWTDKIAYGAAGSLSLLLRAELGLSGTGERAPDHLREVKRLGDARLVGHQDADIPGRCSRFETAVGLRQLLEHVIRQLGDPAQAVTEIQERCRLGKASPLLAVE